MSALQLSEADIDLGLRTLVVFGGNERAAAKQMEAEGRPVSKESLVKMRDETHPHKYLQLQFEMANDVSAAMANRATEIAVQADDTSEKLIRRANEVLNAIPEKDVARSALQMAQLADLNTRRTRLLREQPESITRIENPDDLLADLEAMGVARRIPNAEVVEDT